MSAQPTIEQPEPRKPSIHDADLDGLAIRRTEPHLPRRNGRGRWWLWLLLLTLVTGGAFVAWKSGLTGYGEAVEVTPVVRMPAGGVSGLAATARSM